MPLEEIILPQTDLFVILSGYASQIIGGIIVLAILGVVGMFIWKRNWFRRMPIYVEDWELSGNQVIPRQRRAARIQKKDEEYLLFRDGEKWIPPTFDSFRTDKGGKQRLYIFTPTKGVHQIIEPHAVLKGEINRMDFKIIEKNQLARYNKVLDDKKAEQKWYKKTTLDKLIPIITIAIALISLGLFFWFLMQYGFTPAMERADIGMGMIKQSEALLEKSNELLDKAVQYIEMVDRTKPIPTG
jgi:hypothetical protein